MNENLGTIFAAVGAVGVLIGWAGSIIKKSSSDAAKWAVNDERWRLLYEWVKGVDNAIGAARKVD